MKRIAVDELKKGNLIGENINDSDGKLLVGAGSEVNNKIIDRLLDQGIKSVMILEPGEKPSTDNDGFKFLEGLKNKYGSITNLKKAINDKEKEKKEENNKKNEPAVVIRKSTPSEVKKPVIVVKKSSTSIPVKETVDAAEELNILLKEAKEDLKKIVLEAKEKGTIIPFNLSEDSLKMFNSIITKKDVLTVLKKIKEYDRYLYEHSLYCGIMGIVAGEMMGYQKIVLFSMGLAGLLMDSGMIEVPKEIIDKKAVLKPEEREIVKKHSAKSYSIIGGISQTTDIAKEIALNHHERIDGTGYPKGKKGDEISDYTKLMTIIDVYHALLSERPYHQAKNSKEAFYSIFMYKGKQFDEKILAEIIKKKGGK